MTDGPTDHPADGTASSPPTEPALAQVGVVRNGQAELVPITIGRDYGSTVEVVTGLQPTDQVIANPSDSLISGTPVRIKAQPNNQSTPQPAGGTTP